MYIRWSIKVFAFSRALRNNMKTPSFLLVSFWAYVVSTVRGVSVTFSSKNICAEPVNKWPGPLKNYTGLRISQESVLVVFYHGQTVAIVESTVENVLLNCELMQVRTHDDKRAALKSLKNKIPVQILVSFDDFEELLELCQQLEFPVPQRHIDNFVRSFYENISAALENKKCRSEQSVLAEVLAFFKGIFPGTKWCGIGDTAKTFYDLGSEAEVDKCCRRHDCCPIKVKGRSTQYNITNNSFYSRVHCRCDDDLFDCFKKIKTKTSLILGKIFFNLLQTSCLEEVQSNEIQQNSIGNKKKCVQDNSASSHLQFTSMKRKF